MNEVENEQELSKYIEEWVKNHYCEWNSFYYDVRRNRKTGIYLLKEGTELMNLLDSIMGNIEEKFCLPSESSHLIPTQFASVSHLVSYLKRFKMFVSEYKPIIDENITNGEKDDYIILGIYRIIDEIEQVADRCERIYSHGDMPRPYQILRERLFNMDIDGFVECVNSVLSGVPYLSRKEKLNEGHFQTMLQLLLTVLGFEPIAELPLSDGRIDMIIKLNTLTYVFEFKYTNGTMSMAKKALKQIKDKRYAEPYKLTSKEIIGVGISFSGATKSINGMVSEILFETK